MALSFLDRHRHAQLLAVLGTLLVGKPFLDGSVGDVLSDILLVAAMASAVIGCSTRHRERFVGLGLMAVAQGMAYYRRYIAHATVVDTGYAVMSILFFGYVTVLVLRDVFRQSRSASADTICGALTVYLMLGVLWAFGYALLEELVPGSILGLRTANPRDFYQYLGYSMVTLTTLGYGNIVPGNARADALATAEAIVGQVYLTVLVARLVALNLAETRDRRRDQNRT